MSTRPDLLSSMSEIPSALPRTQETDRSVITRNDDGSISVASKDTFGDEYREISHKDQQPEDWNENLADALTPQERMEIADDLVELFETDERVREQHFRRLTDGLELLGLKDRPSAAFEGGSTVTHPVIAEAITQFQARAIEEMFPPQGPVKPFLVGKVTDERLRQGDRLADYMNYQLTEEDDEYFWSTDQMLFYLPMSGSAFKKVYLDEITGMTTSRFVTAEDFVVPYNARSLQSAPRYFHRFDMPANDVRRAQESGSFLEDARLLEDTSLPIEKISDQFGRGDMEDVADSRSPVVHEDDVVYQFIEAHIDYSMPWDDEDEIAPPYIVTVERESREVVAVRRNWKHDDETMMKRVWFVHYKYLPGLGFYGFGLLHVIGSLAKAISGAINALIDSAIVANLQGGFRTKELSFAGEMRFKPGQWQAVEASIEDLQKGFFNIPAKEPSVALANLTTALIEEARRFATVTENMVGDADNRGPVGTTLALIEQGSKVFSGIHKRMHVSARQEFKLIATLNYEFMDRDEYPYEVQGEERTVLREDFDGRVDVIPVSDPNIWSSTQRIAQAQAGIELATNDPTLYSKKARIILHRRMHEAIRTPDIDLILPELRQSRCDPVTENMDFLVGKAGKVFPDQDHQAHIAIHMNFAQNGAAENPELWKQVDPIVQAHVMEHRAYLYREEVEQQLGIKLPPIDLDEDEREELPPEIEDMISIAVAKNLKPPKKPGADQEAKKVMDKAEAEDQARDMKTIGDLERAMTSHRERMREDRETFAADQRRADDEHVREQARLDDAHRREQKREDEESKAEIARKRKETFGVVRKPTSNSSGQKRTRRKKR